MIFPFPNIVSPLPYEKVDLKKRKQEILAQLELNEKSSYSKNDILEVFESLHDRGFYEDCLLIYTKKNLFHSYFIEIYPTYYMSTSDFSEFNYSQKTFELLKSHIAKINIRYIRAKQLEKANFIISLLNGFKSRIDATVFEILEPDLSIFFSSLDLFFENLYVSQLRIKKIKKTYAFSIGMAKYIGELPNDLGVIKSKYLNFLEEYLSIAKANLGINYFDNSVIPYINKLKSAVLGEIDY